MAYEYKVVPFLGRMRGSASADEVSAQLERTINSEVSNGWEFYQLGDVNIEVSPGCIASLLGQKISYMRFDQVIFRRPEERRTEASLQRLQPAAGNESSRSKPQSGTQVGPDISQGLSTEAISVLQRAKSKGYE